MDLSVLMSATESPTPVVVRPSTPPKSPSDDETSPITARHFASKKRSFDAAMESDAGSAKKLLVAKPEDDDGVGAKVPSSSRKNAHILSEQRRRENINGGFQMLKNSVPYCKGAQDSKAVILKKAVEYIAALEYELNALRYSMYAGSAAPPQHHLHPQPHIAHAHYPPPPPQTPVFAAHSAAQQGAVFQFQTPPRLAAPGLHPTPPPSLQRSLSHSAQSVNFPPPMVRGVIGRPTSTPPLAKHPLS